MNEQTPPTTRRGRRASEAAPDAGVSEEFIAEALSFSGGKLPDTAPITQTPVEEHATAGSAIKAGGAFAGFAVFGDPEKSTAPPTAFTIHPAPVVDVSRDVGVTEKPDYYEDTTLAGADHNIRFQPGKALSISRRNAFKANDHGVPIFAPGWDAASVGRHYTKKAIALTVAALIAAGASLALVLAGTGTNSDYQALLEDGTEVEATVGNVIMASDVDSETDQTAVAPRSSTKTVETASIEFILDGKTYQRELTHTSSGESAMLGKDPTWVTGQKLGVLVDPSDTTRIMAVDPDEWGPMNWITLSPLLPAVTLLAGTGLAFTGAHKMNAIKKATAYQLGESED